MSLNRLTLVLNASYEPVNIITVRRALVMVCKGVAVVEVPSAYKIKTAVMSFPAPSIIRLREYRKIPHQTRSVSRKAILMRDRMTCQYCHQVLQPKSATLDHVIPQSRGGKNVWDNLVVSCKPCNNKKGDQMPVEAGMVLAHKPARIGIHAKHRLIASTTEQPEWDRYLFC